MKKCTKCGEEKSADSFSPDPKGWLSRSSRCKLCAASAAARYRAENAEAIKLKAAEAAKDRRYALAERRAKDNYRKRHREKVQKADQERAALYRDELRDPYLRAAFRRQQIRNPTPEFIALKREQLQLRRLSKKLHSAANTRKEPNNGKT